jgi:hypothetical protein
MADPKILISSIYRAIELRFGGVDNHLEFWNAHQRKNSDRMTNSYPSHENCGVPNILNCELFRTRLRHSSYQCGDILPSPYGL